MSRRQRVGRGNPTFQRLVDVFGSASWVGLALFLWALLTWSPGAASDWQFLLFILALAAIGWTVATWVSLFSRRTGLALKAAGGQLIQVLIAGGFEAQDA